MNQEYDNITHSLKILYYKNMTYMPHRTIVDSLHKMLSNTQQNKFQILKDLISLLIQALHIYENDGLVRTR